jgi:phage baseplate assembly protein W
MAKYTDIDLNFTKNELTNDVSLKYDVNAVNQSIKNIILTTQGERPFDPNFGGNAYNLLFNQPSNLELELFRISLSASLSLNEPRINLENIDIIKNDEDSFWEIKVSYSLVTDPEVLKDLTVKIGSDK